MPKSWIIFALIFSLLGIGIYSYLPSFNEKSTFRTVTIKKGTIEKQAIAVGFIVPAHSISIKSQIDGIVGDVYVEVGQKVEQGQALIKVRPNPTPQSLTDASTDLMRSEAELESAKQKLHNLEGLVQQGIIPANYDEYVTALARVKSEKANVLQKKQNLALIRSGEASVGEAHLTSTIYAPIDGTVLNQKVEVGEPIISTQSSQAATEMMSLANMNHLIFKGSVSEQDVALLSPDMPVSLSVAPYPDQKLTGVLSKVAIQSETLNSPEDASSAKSFENGFEVEVEQLTIPEGIELRSGFSSTAEITLQQSIDVLTIPERVLQFDGETPYVLIPDNSQSGFYKKEVQLGLSDGIRVEVISGLELNEIVIDSSMMDTHTND
ncbi:efflux RND transporter periplasmic adaptor subunit [Vibrio sagamiensis]|uniref:Membrane protein n=1 Tax=Vibrio sagamiensis NBRC 104589 TaxID=1219064 RepID=A0A511QIW5_9VIBR|nr:efflux RND transporter periplasmic adaptor subunit [Vibrio sagamiensis]PNQ54606.1 efflux RND transporter periplasmic adaptor subunit [Vibrio agarivorans]GEM76402.1 membrane protein [Vibrio sagamiensis NBRC 104589]